MCEDSSLFVSAKHLDEAPHKKVWLRTLIRRLFEKWLGTAFHLSRCDYFGRRKRTCLRCDRSTANRGDAYCLVCEWGNSDLGKHAAEMHKVTELLCCCALCFFCATSYQTQNTQRCGTKSKPFNLFGKQIITCAAHDGAVSLHWAGHPCVLVCCCLSTLGIKQKKTAAMSQKEIPVDLIRTFHSCRSLFMEVNGPCPAQMTDDVFSVAAEVNIQSSWGTARCANELISRGIQPLTTYAPILWHTSLS